MTAVQRRYQELRDEGLSHSQAIGGLAVQLNVDPSTIRRILDRAKREADKDK
jgi:hypothetical protein